ncbi:P-II family nitrogen regulator [Urechidicola vernalis]|uniref:P-II family nitrogen regulator n=1 Tax=Urechidicola vernalis TaxID=3075600 RepID=A0ABU2Y2U0_9FLAO|nr:P-II family nitrogen regulator [Urechidicola sp. P050]MDT0552105.1 P-II family nitrogen regulator [Urechidicola sp. P050]
MRKIEAIIRKSKFRHVKLELKDKGIERFNYHLVRSSSESEHRFYRGVEYDAQAEERVKLTVYVDVKAVQDVLGLILNSGKTGDAKEAIIGVYKAEKMYRIVDENGKEKLIELI